MRRRRGIMGLNGGAGIPVITATATGNPLTFETDLVRPLKSLVIPFTSIQEGAGDPSPTNVRPISGWTGANVYQRGKNLFDNSDPQKQSGKIRNDSGTVVNDNTGSYAAQFVAVRPNTQYKISGFVAMQSKRVYFLTIDKSWISRTYTYSGVTTVSITTPENCYFIQLQSAKIDTYENVQIEVGNNATAHEKFHGNILPINWQSEAGTIGGGTLTLNEDGSADIVANKANKIYIGDASESWAKFGSGSASAFAMRCPLPNFINRDGSIIANCLKTIGKDSTWGNNDNWVSWAVPDVLITGIKSITTVDAWQAYLAENPLTIVYNLRSSLSYHLDNVGQLVTFLGTNTIWTDTNGTNTATYLKHQS